MNISVVVATKDRPTELTHLVRRLARILDPGDEVVIVDQSSCENTVVVTESIPGLHYVYNPKIRNLPEARNQGIHISTQAVVAFLDDDAYPLDDWRDAVQVALARHADADGFAGPALEPYRVPLNNWTGGTGIVVTSIGRVKRNMIGRLITEDVCSAGGCNMVFRRSALEQVGGFDARFGGPSLFEEVDLCYRLGRRGSRVRWIPEMRVVHTVKPSGGTRTEASDRIYWRGHNLGLFMAKNRTRHVLLAGLVQFGILIMKHALGMNRLDRAMGFARGYLEGAQCRHE